MYKLLIVDDNVLEREGIKQILDWGKLGIEVVGLCENGKQALDYIQENKVDIIISDIEMPILNGLDMLKEINRRNLDIKTIFMSCYDEFDFAKSAIDMEASAYMLKPLIKEELESVTKKLLNIYKQKSEDKKQRELLIEELNKSRPALREQYFRNLLFSSSGALQRDTLGLVDIRFGNKIKYRVFNIVIEKVGDTEILNHDDIFIAVCAVKDLIEKRRNNYIPIIITNNMIACIVYYDKSEEESILNDIVECKKLIEQKFGIWLSMGTSGEEDSINNVHLLYEQANQVIKMQTYSHFNKVVLYEDISTSEKASVDSIDLHDLQEKVQNIIYTRNLEKVMVMIDCYLGDTSLHYTDLYIKSFTYSLLNILELILIELNLSFDDILGREKVWSKLSTFNTIVNVKMWIYNIFFAIIEHIEKNQKSKNYKIASEIKKVIEDNYNKHITVEDVAERINFSGTHANNIFKEEMGITIFDYLTEFRMNKAKQLLQEKDSKIYVVSNEVGYKNKSHFCMLFKQYVGTSPMEYKNLNK